MYRLMVLVEGYFCLGVVGISGGWPFFVACVWGFVFWKDDLYGEWVVALGFAHSHNLAKLAVCAIEDGLNILTSACVLGFKPAKKILRA